MSVTRTNKLLEKAQQGKSHMTREIADLIAKNKKLTKKCEEQDVEIKSLTAKNGVLSDKVDELSEKITTVRTGIADKLAMQKTGTLADIATAVPVE